MSDSTLSYQHALFDGCAFILVVLATTDLFLAGASACLICLTVVRGGSSALKYAPCRMVKKSEKDMIRIVRHKIFDEIFRHI
jgi:hypothetical protein